MAVAELDEVHMIGKITEAALLSGTVEPRTGRRRHRRRPARPWATAASSSTRTSGRCSCCPTTSGPRCCRPCATIYDGRYDRAVGVDGGRHLTWRGHAGFIAGCTPAIDNHHAVVAAARRPVTSCCASPCPTPSPGGQGALTVDGDERRCGATWPPPSLGVLDHLDRRADAAHRRRPGPGRPTGGHDACAAAPTVDRDGYSREIVNVPPPEQPARFAKQLGKLLAALTRSAPAPRGPPSPACAGTQCRASAARCSTSSWPTTTSARRPPSPRPSACPPPPSDARSRISRRTGSPAARQAGRRQGRPVGPRYLGAGPLADRSRNSVPRAGGGGDAHQSARRYTPSPYEESFRERVVGDSGADAWEPF